MSLDGGHSWRLGNQRLMGVSCMFISMGSIGASTMWSNVQTQALRKVMSKVRNANNGRVRTLAVPSIARAISARGMHSNQRSHRSLWRPVKTKAMRVICKRVDLIAMAHVTLGFRSGVIRTTTLTTFWSIGTRATVIGRSRITMGASTNRWQRALATSTSCGMRSGRCCCVPTLTPTRFQISVV